MDNRQAIENDLCDYLEEKGIGKKAVNYQAAETGSFPDRDTGELPDPYDLLRALRLGAGKSRKPAD